MTTLLCRTFDNAGLNNLPDGGPADPPLPGFAQAEPGAKSLTF